MRVTTTTDEEVSLEMQKSVPSDTSRSLPPETKPKRSRATLIAGQRILLLAPPIIVAVVLLVSWYISTATGSVPSFILPPPRDVFTVLSDGLQSGLFLSNALVTIQESLLGFLLAVVLALPLGYGLAKSRLFAAA